MTGDRGSTSPGHGVRPESALLALFGKYVLGQDRLVAMSGVIDVLARMGIGEHATRAALKRMMRRGLLSSTRDGRRVHLGLTPYAVTVLRDGEARLEADVVDEDWDGQWTLLAFSVPESRRADRHALRAHLGWAGFGLLKNGLWIAPAATDVSPVLEELNLLDCVRIFRGGTITPTRPEEIVREAWNLDDLADGYQRFLDRWERGAWDDLDALPRQVLLHAEWLLLIREDPRLPLALLPRDWPGVRAQRLFRTLREQLATPARALADSVLGMMPVPDPDDRAAHTS